MPGLRCCSEQVPATATATAADRLDHNRKKSQRNGARLAMNGGVSHLNQDLNTINLDTPEQGNAYELRLPCRCTKPRIARDNPGHTPVEAHRGAAVHCPCESQSHNPSLPAGANDPTHITPAHGLPTKDRFPDARRRTGSACLSATFPLPSLQSYIAA